MPVNEIRRLHVRGVLDSAAAEGYARSTIKHLLVDIASVFKDLLADEIVATDPTKHVPLPAGAKVDRRERVRVTDAEFAKLLESPTLDVELAIMAVMSRCLGGMRASDLHALDWSANTLVVVRPKTERRDTFSLPPDVRAFVEGWHWQAGEPTSGAIFPVRRGGEGRRDEGEAE